MSTQKQTEANRRNALHSTGPRSAEGKAASSTNALKSGIDAKSQIIRGERAVDLEALKTEYYDRFRPATPEQRMLVDVLIDSEWLLRRFRVVEAQLWDYSARTLYKQTEGQFPLGKAFDCGDRTFLRLQRRVDTALRNYRNALQDLRLLQAAAPEPDPAPAPQPNRPVLPDQSVTPANGFVPQTVPNPPAQPAATPQPDNRFLASRPDRSSL